MHILDMRSCTLQISETGEVRERRARWWSSEGCRGRGRERKAHHPSGATTVALPPPTKPLTRELESCRQVVLEEAADTWQ